MAKNQINFSKMREDAKNQLNAFKESAQAIAVEDLRFKSAMKPLKARLESILEMRKNDIAQGMDADEVARKFPRVEVDNQMRAEEEKHKNICAPLKKAMEATYVFVPDGMHSAYVRKIDEGKRGDFLTCVSQFLVNLGIENCGQAQISKLAESMSDKFGAKYATSKKIVEDGVFTTAMKKNQFNKLFMAVFCDMYVK